MRIVQLLTQPSGGPADHVADIAPRLARRGHDVTVVMPDGAAADRVDAAGVRRVAASVDHKTDVRGAADVVRVLRQAKPDVLHCQDRRAGLIGRTLGAVARPRGIVYTLHGAPESLGPLVPGNLAAAPPRRRDRLYYLTLERWLARVGHGRVVAPSDALARYLVDHVRVPSSMVDVVRNGVDVARFAPGAGSGSPLRVAWVGLMVPVKRLDVLLAALEQVPDVTAVLAGDGPLRDEVAAIAARQPGRIELAGFVDDPAPVLAGADAFVLPSAAENCPLALLQAMATALPVVASRVGGIPEVVTDGESGLLVPPGEVGPLVTALRRLADDEALRRRLGAAARAAIEARFDLDVCVDGLTSVYERAVRSNDRSR
jgi:glycosyltransferase involved in cell wall biosynthesis